MIRPAARPAVVFHRGCARCPARPTASADSARLLERGHRHGAIGRLLDEGTAYAGSPAAFRWTAICSTGWARRPSAPPLLCGAAGRGARIKVGQDGLAYECMRKLDADGHSAQEVGAGQLVQRGVGVRLVEFGRMQE